MKVSAAVKLVLLLSVVDSTLSVKCGTALTKPCLCADDVRYCTDIPSSIVGQDPRWKIFQGYWKVTINSYDGDGNLLQPSAYDPTTGTGYPFTQDTITGYYNYTLIGSRLHVNNRFFSPPANAQTFCTIPWGYPLQNFMGNGSCGLTGDVSVGGFFGAATHDNDGKVDVFRTFGRYSISTEGQATDFSPPGTISWLDEGTLNNANSLEGIFAQNNNFVFLNNATALLNSMNIALFRQSRSRSTIETLERMEEADWIAEVNQAYVDNYIPAAKQMLAPYPGVSLDSTAYPTEADWCGGMVNDSSCTVSPFQEPPGEVKPGAIAGFTIASFVIFAVLVFAIYRYHLKQQEHRIKIRFVRNVARNISIAPSPGALTPKILQKQFAHIEKKSGGNISKEDLREWMSDGKLGEVSEADFNALWAAMDLYDTGNVDFVSFMTFLSGCGEAFEKVYEEQKSMSKSQLMRLASRRLSRMASIRSSFLEDVSECRYEGNDPTDSASFDFASQDGGSTDNGTKNSHGEYANGVEVKEGEEPI